MKAIDCLQLLGNYEAIIQCIYETKDSLSEDERNSMLNKFAPHLFNSFLDIYHDNSNEEEKIEEIKEEPNDWEESEEESPQEKVKPEIPIEENTSFEKIDESILRIPNFDPQDPFMRDCVESVVISLSSFNSESKSFNSDFSIIDN